MACSWRGWLLLVAVACAVAGSAGAESAPKITALLVQQSGPAFVVYGSDESDHIVYDLVVTNAFPAPVTLTSVEVLQPNGRGLLRLQGEALGSFTKPLIGGQASATIPASSVVDTIIDVIVPHGAAPRELTHRISYALPASHPTSPVIESDVIDGPLVRIHRRTPVVIAPPLSGDGWYNANGCCGSGDADHRVARLPVDGAVLKHPETFAIDWVKEAGGRFFSGDGSALTDHFAFGAVVVSATDGTVTSARDGQPEQVPLQPPRGISENIDYPGNFVIIRVRPHVYAFYAHFQPGSVAVKVGDRVKVGQRLGLLGNSGNSNVPHLHFGLMDGPNWASSDSLPFVVNDMTLAGMSPGDPFDAIHPQGESGMRRDTYPLVFSVVNFGRTN